MIAAETETEGAAVAHDDRPKVFRELDAKGKAVRVVTIAFLVLHLGCMLIGGAIGSIQKVFKPFVGFYTDALRMTNSWGMFGKPPTATNVEMEAVKTDGTVVVLATTDAHDRSLSDRIRDTRMRKFLGRLSEEGDRRRLGEFFLDYYCEVAKKELGAVREVHAKNFLHETRDDDGKVTRAASTQIILTRRCGPELKILPRRVLPILPDARLPQQTDL